MLRRAEKESHDEEAVNNADLDETPPDVLWYNLNSFIFEVGENAKFAAPVLLQTVDLDQEEWAYNEFEATIHFLALTNEPTDDLLTQIITHPEVAHSLSWETENTLLSLAEQNPHFFRRLVSRPTLSPEIRILAMQILGSHDTRHAGNLESLESQLKDPHPAVRKTAIETLGQMQVEKSKVVEILTKATKDPRVRVRAKALENLSKFGADAKPALQQIQAALSDDYLTIQIAAIRCLGELGKDATPTIDELEKLTKSETFLLRDEAKIALKKIRRAD